MQCRCSWPPPAILLERFKLSHVRVDPGSLLDVCPRVLRDRESELTLVESEGSPHVAKLSNGPETPEVGRVGVFNDVEPLAFVKLSTQQDNASDKQICTNLGGVRKGPLWELIRRVPPDNLRRAGQLAHEIAK